MSHKGQQRTGARYTPVLPVCGTQQEQQELPPSQVHPQLLLPVLPPQQQNSRIRMMMSQIQEQLLLSKHMIVTSLFCDII